ncbi:MAG: 50S ribosomal protein L25 [Bacteroidetes bacterium]|nr:50S ribosomal protein L25 [Bacteroidota bacterium]
MDVIKLNGLTRTDISKSANKKLRISGQIPGVLYHKGDANLHFSVSNSEMLPVIHGGQAHVIELSLDSGKKVNALLKELQFDPVSDRCIHFDLQMVAGNEKITVSVPVHTTGVPVGVSKNGGMLQVIHHHVRVRADQKHLPDHITLDVSGLDIGQAIHAGEIKLDGIQVMEEASVAIVSVVRKRADDHVAAPEQSLAEPELITKGKKEDK